LEDPDGNPCLYALFTSADSNGAYLASTVVRYEVLSNGDLDTANATAVWVGLNATALVPAVSGSTTYILVPAIGGKMNYGNTNGTNSNLSYVDAFNGFTTPAQPAPVAITGDASTALSATGNYDIMGAAVSADGANAYLLLVTYDSDYNACWRLFKGALSDILSITTPTQISQVSGLTSVDSGFGDSAGYYWEILYDNMVTGGRLWFLRGTPIQVTAGGNYATVLMQVGYSGTLYDSKFNVNSADLIGEMIYQAARGASVNTRLGTTRTLAKTVRAAAAPEEEEEK
jgi:hypothetical protein